MSILPRSFFRRAPDTHKGDYGRVLVIGGSMGLTGAPAMAAQAALRSGAGLVTVAVPEAVYFIVASKLTEAMVHPMPESPAGTLSTSSMERIRPLIARADVLAVGPGLSQELPAQHFVQGLIHGVDLPIVLDADGINAFAGPSRRKLAKAKGPLILTPHPGEMGRLLGLSTEAVQRNRSGIARKVARELHGVVVLKGHRTVIASPRGQLHVNRTGNAGMASGGMGDLLTGMIAALIGQGLDLFTAAKAGVHLHGLAGDLAARETGQVSLIAADLLAAIPSAFRRVARR